MQANVLKLGDAQETCLFTRKQGDPGRIAAMPGRDAETFHS